MQLETVEDFRDYCSNPRDPQRAKCHLIDGDLLAGYLPTDVTPEFIEDPDFIREINRIVEDTSGECDTLERGDIILIEPFLGYRNEGKMIYDGKNVINLDYDNLIDDYGFVPNQFQILGPENFGPKYWSDIISHNRLVPFNFSERLPGMTVDNVIQMEGRYILPFEGPAVPRRHGPPLAAEIYYIVEDYPGSVQSPEEFLDQLMSKQYFDWAYDPETPGGRPGGEGGDLPEGLDAEHVLLIAIDE